MAEESISPTIRSDSKPEPPREPEPWECCHSGCEPCIYDRYWEAYDRYEKALQVWEQRQAGAFLPGNDV